MIHIEEEINLATKFNKIDILLDKSILIDKNQQIHIIQNGKRKSCI